MRQKRRSYMLIVLSVLTFALVTPQVHAEKSQSKASKTTSKKAQKPTSAL